jgi:hypothetical protein
MVAGTTGSSDGDATLHRGSGDYWVVKLNNIGAIQWQKSFGGSSAESAFGIQQAIDGGYILNGYSSSSDGDVTINKGGTDFWVLKIDGTGNIQWQKSLGGNNDDRGWSVIQNQEGDYVVYGSSNSVNGDVGANNGDRDFWVVKLSTLGDIIWNNTFGGFDLDACHALRQAPDGGYLLAGNCFSNNGELSNNHGVSDILLVKINSAGSKEWQKLLGGPAGDFAYGLQLTSDGGCIVAGGANSNGGDVSGHDAGEDLWVVKLINVVSNGFLIHPADRLSASPNPTNDVIRISVPENFFGNAYQISDGFGRIVLQGNFKDSLHEVDFRRLCKGIYFLKTNTADGTALRFVKH